MLTPTNPAAGVAIRGTVTRTDGTDLFVALPAAPGFEVPATALTGVTASAGDTVVLLPLAGTGDLIAIGTLP